MACVATWAFGLEAVKAAETLLDKGRNCVEVTEIAINCESI